MVSLWSPFYYQKDIMNKVEITISNRKIYQSALHKKKIEIYIISKVPQPFSCYSTPKTTDGKR